MSKDSTAVVRPARNIAGRLRLPGDKSISHRYAMLAAVAHGTSRLQNFSTGADCASTLACMQALGAEVQRREDTVEVRGRGLQLQPPSSPLDCGNSGSTMRMLGGILAGQKFTSELVGDDSLSRRPMARIIAPLEMMGAKIAAQNGGRPPLRITGGALKAISYRLPVASAQVKSCALFAGLFAQGETSVIEPVLTRDHGELALRAFGASLTRSGNETRITGGQELRAIDAAIPGDISSAAFFLCAAALFPGAQLAIEGLLMNPTRARLLDILILLGARVSVTQVEEQHGELRGMVKAEGRSLGAVTIAGDDTASLIDEIPVLAAIAPYTTGGMEIRDARELRVKESDRIAAIAANLRAMGAEVDEREDGLKIPGGQKLRGAEIDSLGDHRIAMAFAVAALRAEGETYIRGADAAVISYPGFFAALESVVQR
ncbi:MAG TPA: 3-phosphoshikimate 1-carboxyvinyltransferase [Terriglobales bacterium]|jgi:3-phosphoshikimate 1-carboxyvinyltransferase|nr:3-phosphoshikimate 1-carboxyvinyltransferase [Terriglobales bacterium]